MKSKIWFSVIRTWQIMTLMGQAALIGLAVIVAFFAAAVGGDTGGQHAWFYPFFFIWIAANAVFTISLFIEAPDTSNTPAQGYEKENKYKHNLKFLIISYLISVCLDITLFIVEGKFLGFNSVYWMLYFFPKILVPFVFCCPKKRP